MSHRDIGNKHDVFLFVHQEVLRIEFSSFEIWGCLEPLKSCLHAWGWGENDGGEISISVPLSVIPEQSIISVPVSAS